MRNTLAALALFVVLTSIPVVSNAQSADQLAAQAEALLQQIAALQAQLAAQTGTGVSTTAPVTSSALCPNIGRVLKLGSTGDDVSRLQRFLAADPSIYPEAIVSGYYGSLTEAAVKRWQTRYNIVSSGDAESTGFGVTGPRTAAAISLQCSTTTGGGSSVQSPIVGGFIQVTPVSGQAPHTVQVTATVNTVNSCQAATYTLDWGDGTIPQSIQVPAGKCGPLQQIYSHIYIYGGQYLVRLSAGDHSTTATVLVYGAGAPTGITTPGVINTTPSLSFSAPSSGQSVTPGGNLGISWTSQNAPSGSKVRLEVYKTGDSAVSGNNDRGLASNTSELPVSGSYTWTTPTGGAVLADAGHSGYGLTPGTYRIVGKLYSGNTCWGFCAGNTTRTIHATAESATFTVNASAQNFSYGPLGVTPLVSGNPLQVAATFNLPTACTGYSLSWGDGTSSTVQAHTTNCAQSEVTRVFTHVYAAGGNYTITLRRGADLDRVDTASVVISN